MSVTLAKLSDTRVINRFTLADWQSTVELYNGLTTVYGHALGNHFYEGLAANDLTSFQSFLNYRDNYDNTTGRLATYNVPAGGSAVGHASVADYADGYGHDYAVGE